jgi:hypothetical protein
VTHFAVQVEDYDCTTLDGAFDCGVALHACGDATDMSMASCIQVCSLSSSHALLCYYCCVLVPAVATPDVTCELIDYKSFLSLRDFCERVAGAYSSS